MSSSLPSHNETPICRSRALYLGTSIFSSDANKFDESQLTLDQLQTTISERYPIDGGQFSKGVETWLSIYDNGLQMEHSTASDTPSISALFYYPIKALVYCGALRFISDSISKWEFAPLDRDIAQTKANSKNPCLFVCLFKGIDSVTKIDIIESNIFVVGTKDIAFSLVESCQQAYNKAKISRSDFYKKYGNIPVVFCLKDELNKKKVRRVVVKQFDLNGYFYATENTDIDLWQLFEVESDLAGIQIPTENVYYENVSKETVASEIKPIINPYEEAENLISVSKRIDPETGQNIYVRYLQSESGELQKTNKYDDFEKIITSAAKSSPQMPPILVREERTPSPIVYERYIRKKAPQVIIKEIHVQDPSPPPIKYVTKPIDKYHNQVNISNQDQIEKPKANISEDKPPKSSILKDKITDKLAEITKSKKNTYRPEEPTNQTPTSNLEAAPVGPFGPEPPARVKPRSQSRKVTENDSTGLIDKSVHEQIYADVEHIKASNKYSNQPYNTPQSNPNNQGMMPEKHDPNGIIYREYNPYSTYYNNNGQPGLRSNYDLTGHYSSQKKRIYEAPQNPYSNNNNLYSGHGNYYDVHAHYNGYNNNPYQRHYGYGEPQNVYHNRHEQKKYIDSYENLHSKGLNQNEKQRAKTTYLRNDYNREEKIKPGHSKKKIYLVNENELEELKAKLTKDHRNKKIVIVDESEVDSLRYYNKMKDQMSRDQAHHRDRSRRSRNHG